MHTDRLVVRKPGGLFGSESVSNLGREYASTARIVVLLRLLEDVAILRKARTVRENRGSGIHVTIQAPYAETLESPVLRGAFSYFKVTLSNGRAGGGRAAERSD